MMLDRRAAEPCLRSPKSWRFGGLAALLRLRVARGLNLVVCRAERGVEGRRGELGVCVDARIDVVAARRATPAARDDAHDLSGADVDRWPARVAATRRAVDLELTRPQHRPGFGVRRGARGEDDALIARDALAH